MSLSSDIAGILLEMLEENGSAEIRRNELAQTLGCVPSQINYVISSRFTPEHGFVVESRRGGGGCIRITRVSMDGRQLLQHVLSSIGDSADYLTCRTCLSNLMSRGLIDRHTAVIMLSALSDNALHTAPPGIRDALRASILKQMLISNE